MAGGGSYTLSRVVNTASSIVGSWLIPGENISVTFLDNNTYYLAEEANDAPFGYTGIEKGTYSWNSITKAFSATATIDTNGDVGVNGVPPGVTVNITGNSSRSTTARKSPISTAWSPIRLRSVCLTSEL